MTADLAHQAEAFCEASIRDWTGRAARMLAATPEIAGYSFATAVILGDADRVRTEIGRDPGLATRLDARSGWTPLHAVSASRWHRLDPGRAEGLLAVARMLLDAGADPNGRTGGQGGHGGWTPLRCAVAGAANPLITRLLLERGAVPGDHDLYLAGFGDDSHECLRLLLRHATNVAQIARMALAAPISTNYTEGVRLLLEAGADIEARDTNWNSTPIDWAAVGSGEQPAGNPRPDWTAAAAVLLEAGASVEDITLSPEDPKPPSPEVAALLRRHGAPAQYDGGRH
jgi:hypothetical protein